jgi:hypothetical protein
LSTGVDIAQEQIQAARHRAESLGVAAQFHVAAAEETGLPTASFDVVTASQSWLYFDKERVIAEVKRARPEISRVDPVLLRGHIQCSRLWSNSAARLSRRRTNSISDCGVAIPFFDFFWKT